ncbi:enhanced serine sensitivity protein SseB C-terminal domain-containing protein [Hymenobacter psoromatis]|uniref:enhanced serine sensitivity protein SseB C-terminal domain-containing protein n=1 Tax=Hymenobacter psoromatis TaxID=1484116 RepID=UPI001CC0EF9C|nr:enhanced serine sensitivity protein SseB C-terminal domain-containing protein [Hymenobacter psoromatis]
MGIFDFLKPKPAASPAPAATLEELLAQAAADPAYQPEFYRRLLLESLFFYSTGTPDTTRENNPMLIPYLTDGRVPIFTSPARIFDKGIVTFAVAQYQMKGRDLLEMLPGKTLMLNPYSDFGKELLPAEIAQILAGTILDTGTRLTVEKATTVRIGQPAAYPTDMVQALARLLSQQPRARAAYLAWIHDPAAPEPPHYIICLDVEGEMRTISQQVGFVAQQFIGKSDIIDIVQADQSSLTDYFRQTKPFYEG